MSKSNTLPGLFAVGFSGALVIAGLFLNLQSAPSLFL